MFFKNCPPLSTASPKTPKQWNIQLLLRSLKQGHPANNVDVNYVDGTGDHATTLEVLWQVVGVDPVFGHVTPVNLEGQTVGPFPPGVEVRFKTRVSNSAGEAESEVKSITL